MPFARWMALCLFHPEHGYYMKPGRKTGYGHDADFVTPPTLHPFFGEAIGKEVIDCWKAAGRPAAFSVAEFGGGEGDLARNAMACIDRDAPDLAAALTWTHLEFNPRHGQPTMDAAKGQRTRWIDAGDYWHRLPASLSIGAFDVVVACEVADAQPISIVEFVGGRTDDADAWREIRVTWRDGGFHEYAAPLDAVPVLPQLGRGLPPNLGAGARFRIDDQAGPWFEDDACFLAKRNVLVIDYGLMGDPRDGDARTRAYSKQALVSLLHSPGDVDMTVDVDFQALRVRAPFRYFEEACFESLEHFLLRHGILDVINAIDRSSTEGTSSYLRLRQLLLPTGLGSAFKVQRFDRIPLAPDSDVAAGGTSEALVGQQDVS